MVTSLVQKTVIWLNDIMVKYTISRSAKNSNWMGNLNVTKPIQ